jgi:hypothetical protein
MHPYSHAYLARWLEAMVRPEQPGEYLWGAVFPDVRYLSGLPREQTHLPLPCYPELAVQYPRWRAFLQGCLVHCLLDEVDLGRQVGAAFPLNFVQAFTRKPFSRQRLSTLVEFHYLQIGAPLQPCEAAANPLTEAWGVREGDIRDYAQAMQTYLAHPALETGLEAYQRMGMFENARIAHLVATARRLEARPIVKRMLLWGVQNAHLEAAVTRLAGHAICEMGPS